jgi:hypothetical protein
MQFEPNPGHEEEYENYLESWSEDLRDNVMFMLQGINRADLFDGGEIRIRGGDSNVDAVVETYAVQLEVTLPAINFMYGITAVGYTAESHNCYGGLNCTVARNHTGEWVAYDGRTFNAANTGETVHETMNDAVVKYIIDRALLDEAATRE